MAMTTYLSLVSPDRNALLDVVDGAEAAFFEYGLAPDVDSVRRLTGTEPASAADGHADTEDARPDHCSSDFVAEVSRFHADRLHYREQRREPTTSVVG